MGELYAPQLQTRVSELGQFKLQLAIIIFIAIGAHRYFIKSLLESYEFIPALTFPEFAVGWSRRSEVIVKLNRRSFKHRTSTCGADFDRSAFNRSVFRDNQSRCAAGKCVFPKYPG